MLSQNGHGSGHPPDGLIIIDWSDDADASAELVDGFAIAGRWTAIAAAAKAGKSSLLVSVSVEISEGRHPFEDSTIEPVRVLYIDAEMGRLDLRERLEDCGYKPALLERWSACDIPPRLDTTAGAALVLDFVREHQVQCVVIDGINGTVSGAEKDDTPWRLLFEHTIRPLKEMGVAVVTADNHGKDAALGPRGSSVKLDKADAVLMLARTTKGVSLHASHRRTAAYAVDLSLDVFGIEGDEPIRYRRSLGETYPTRTAVAALLDELGIDPTVGRGKVRQTLRRAATEAGDPRRYRVRNDALSAAIRWRKHAQMGGTRLPRRETESHAVRPGTGQNGPLGDSASGQVEAQPCDQAGQVGGTSGTHDLASVGDGGGVVDTPVPNAAADPNDVLF